MGGVVVRQQQLIPHWRWWHHGELGGGICGGDPPTETAVPRRSWSTVVVAWKGEMDFPDPRQLTYSFGTEP